MANRSEFVGLMITHAPRYGNLDLSEKTYFYKRWADFNNSYMVEALLLKPVDWLVNPKMKGILSKEGIVYVASIVKGINPITWDEHLKKSAK